VLYKDYCKSSDEDYVKYYLGVNVKWTGVVLDITKDTLLMAFKVDEDAFSLKSPMVTQFIEKLSPIVKTLSIHDTLIVCGRIQPIPNHVRGLLVDSITTTGLKFHKSSSTNVTSNKTQSTNPPIKDIVELTAPQVDLTRRKTKREIVTQTEVKAQPQQTQPPSPKVPQPSCLSRVFVSIRKLGKQLRNQFPVISAGIFFILAYLISSFNLAWHLKLLGLFGLTNIWVLTGLWRSLFLFPRNLIVLVAHLPHYARIVISFLCKSSILSTVIATLRHWIGASLSHLMRLTKDDWKKIGLGFLVLNCLIVSYVVIKPLVG